MRRRDVLRTGAVAGVAVLAGCVGETDEVAFQDGFEVGIGRWEGDAAIGPEVEIEDFE